MTKLTDEYKKSGTNHQANQAKEKYTTLEK